MRVVVADDQPEVRSALKLIVEQLVGYQVVGEVADSPALLESCRGLHPDLVLLDWELPGARLYDDGRLRHGAVAALQAVAPAVRIVALSVRADASGEAIAAGADAFVCKADPPRRLIEALSGLTA